jgi:hypothetical protein
MSEADAAVTGSRQIVFSSARRAPRRRWRRVAGSFLALLALLVGAAALLAGSLWLYSWTKLGGERIGGLNEDTAALGGDPPAGPADATTVLVLLTSPHDPTVPSPPELRGPALLVQTGGPREVPAVLALPAELPLSVDGGPTSSIGEVQQEGDVDALVTALADYTGVRIDHAVRVSEDLLPGLVDLHAPERCDGGTCRPLTPEEVRRVLAEGSVQDRVDATTGILGAVAAELDVVGSLTRPLRSKRTIDLVDRDVRTDVSLRGTGLLDLARQLEGTPEPQFAEVPLLTNPETGRPVQLEQAETLFQRFREGSSLEVADSEEPAEPSPEELAGTVDVAILNGAGIDGLAGRVEARLAAEGFRVVGTGNAAAFSDGGTTITYDAGDPAAEVAAILLRERLEGAALEPSAGAPTFEGEPVGVVVTVGADLDDGA